MVEIISISLVVSFMTGYIVWDKIMRYPVGGIMRRGVVWVEVL